MARGERQAGADANLLYPKMHELRSKLRQAVEGALHVRW